MLGGLVSNRIY